MGQFTLLRAPQVANDKLRAWDAADEYLINHVAEHYDAAGRVLLVNDTHGALATVLHARNPVSWGDSVNAFHAARGNRQRNLIDAPLTVVPSTDTPAGGFDLVLIKIPKTTALLEDQLARLRSLISTDTIIIGAGMVKHMQKSAFAAFEQLIGPVSTSLAVKKARLLFAQFDAELKVKPPPATVTYTDPDLGFALENLPNVFSRDRLDHGARFFMTQFSRLPDAHEVIDLGCGNGVLGIYLQTLQAESAVTYIDESFSAVASARRNHQRRFDASSESVPQARFVVENALDQQSDASADLILCNPPFHQQHVVGQQLATALFTDSKRVLRNGGQLWIVANRHLPYPQTLKWLFGHCTAIAGNDKFRILKVVKR